MDNNNNNVFNNNSDICQQLLQRYSKSSAPQHHHLCAIAAATRSIIQSESLPITPFSYFAVTISTISNSQDSLDPQELSGVSSFLAIVLPLVNQEDVSLDKVVEAIGVLVGILEKGLLESEGVLGTSTVRAFVKCLGILVGFCDKEDWDSVKVGFEILVKFSIDKRPKVRKCAHDCIVSLFKSFGSTAVAKKAGKRIYSLIKENTALALKLSALKEISGSKDEHQEVLHSLNILKPIIPYLTVKDNEKVLAQLVELMSSQSSAFTRHIFDNIGAILDSSGIEIILPEADQIIKALVSYMSSAENPADNVLFAANLAKGIIDKLHDGGMSVWVTYLPLVVGSISGLLTRPENIALPASNILKELINGHIDGKKFLTAKKQTVDDEALSGSEFEAVKAICLVFENMLLSSSEYPNDHILAILSVMFLKLGEVLDFCEKGIILKLADWMIVASGGAYDTKNLQECIGSAVVAMGPEKLLALLPISLNTKDYSLSNSWLIPVLNKYVCGSSLGFFLKHVVPLAVSFEQTSSKVKKSVIREELQAYARGCWGLLPAFCHCPSDVHKKAQALTTLLIPFLKEDSFMLEYISAALQELVNKNKNVLASDNLSEELIVHQTENKNLDLALEFKRRCSYSKKSASKNIKALASCSEEWLQALVNVFFESSPAKYQQFKEAIECLTSITDSSLTQRIFTSSMERAGITNDIGEYRKLGPHSTDNKENNSTLLEEVAKRCMILELGSCFIEGSNEDLIEVLFGIARDVLEASHGAGHHEAYHILSKILEKHSWFRSSHLEQLMGLFASVKPPTDTKSLTSRFACYKTLLIDAIQGNMDEENTEAFLILNEIILALKDSTEEGRKTAYDALIGVCSSLRDSSSAKSDESYKKFVDMIIAYLSGSSPHIKSGAVSALSVLVYSDANICLSVPDLVPSVLTLLQSKDVEVTKAVLGFVKVFVSSIKAKDLHNLLSDIVNGVLPWSSVSRHHFKSKVTVIVEILMRKCGVAAVKSVASEKYKNFLKTVSENRHGKSSFKEDGTGEMESTPSDSRQRKRKDRESSDTLEEKDSGGPNRRKKRKEEGVMGGKTRKREMKRKNNTTDEPQFSSGSSAGRQRKREFGHRKQEGDKAPPQKRDNGGRLKRGFPGKGKIDRQKKPAAGVRGSGANKRQKTNKNS
ncbi:hypothetical protein T459_13670 [Capsicum annuum]|uniref:Uncharacterized protein n=1 Tax=Capsicum annuum TaxID=4072 RepID=A0A2G2ZFH1_CAPAN|nr:RRP12-like protein [Capsicum annuum]PHT80655.1 hypothetical protein T459_13670 [Capsicum annuum]